MDANIVISGISGRFPSSDDLEEFKHNLFNGIDMVTEDDLRWPIGLWGLPSRNGKIKSMDKFDADFFHYSDEEVKAIDPQERLLLEITYEALLDAGVNPRAMRGTNTGCFHGSCFTGSNSSHSEPETISKHANRLLTRISQFLDIRGPAFHADTACGSGLMAFNQAFLEVTSGTCDQAIVIAYNNLFKPRISLNFAKMRMISKDGKSKCLDASANGYVRSEAIVCILLQKSSQAKRIHAKVLNSRTNSDGFKEDGVTFPSVDGQIQLIGETYAKIGLKAERIKYVEAHLTGTQAGDVTEAVALHKYFFRGSEGIRDEPLLVGCLKSNIGHTEGTSGLCSIAKALIIFKERQIPPNLHYITPNPKIKGLVGGMLVPVLTVTPFEEDIIPINCFGFGGSNVHVVIQKTVEATATGSVKANVGLNSLPRLVTICGRTRESVQHIYNALEGDARYLTTDFLSLVDDFAKFFPEDGMIYRGYLVVHEEINANITISKQTPQKVNRRPVCLMFGHPEECVATFEALKALPGFNQASKVYEAIMCDNGHDYVKSSNQSSGQCLAMFVTIQVGLLDVLRNMGLEPDAVGGHPLGCAYFDRILTAEEAIFSAHYMGINDKNDLKLRQHFESLLYNISMRGPTGEKLLSVDYFLNSTKAKTLSDTSTIVVEIGSKGLTIAGLTYDHLHPNNNNLLPTMATLGELYMNGANLCVENLYPKPSYPLPSSTPFLSPLIKWDHLGKSWPLKDFIGDESNNYFWRTVKNIEYTFDSNQPTDEFLYDHIIDGRPLFPATGYLMIVWMTLSELMAIPVLELSVRFEQVRFKQATVLTKSKPTRFRVRINEATGSFEVIEGKNCIVDGKVNQVHHQTEKWPLICHQDVDEGVLLDHKAVYKELKVRGYDYGHYFQAVKEAESDGKTGKVIWRDVVSKTVKDSLAIKSEEERTSLWMRSCISFFDCLLQLHILSKDHGHRCLAVPTFMESVTCYPDVLVKEIECGDKFDDPLTFNEATVLSGGRDSDCNTIYTKGLMVKGFKGTIVSRKKQPVSLLKYQFVPFNGNMQLSLNKRKTAEHYLSQVLNPWRIKGGPPFDLEDQRHSLLRLVRSRNKGSEISLENDLLVGKYDHCWYFEEPFLKTVIDLVVFNLIASNRHQTLDLLEVNTTNFILANQVVPHLMENLLSSQYTTKYSLLHPDKSELRQEMTAKVNRVIELNVEGLQILPISDLIIYRHQKCGSTELLLEKLFASTKEGGFLIVLLKQPLDVQIMSILHSFGKRLDPSVRSSQVVKEAESCGYSLISERNLLGSTIPLTCLLFRKLTKIIPLKDQVVIEIGLNDCREWFEPLQIHLKTTDKRRIWLVSKPQSSSTPKITGLVGFVKSLRLEPGGERIRCLVDWTATDPIDLRSDKYKKVVSNDLVYNICVDANQGWGSYEHIALPTEMAEDTDSMKPFDQIYLKTLKPGDLTSLTWTQNNLNLDVKTLKPKQRVYHVYYSPLNFRDIMFSTGRLRFEAIPFVPTAIVQDSILGCEFVGRDENQVRVMGMVPCKALATVVVADNDTFIWPLPENWTMEEAASVPSVYATAYYSLIVRGALLSGESVLIHSGAGGVGLAAITICLSMGCTVYTTVGSNEKKVYLQKEFPQLDGDNILNSRDTNFETEILVKTNGFGVQVILNSLAEEKLQASLRCLSPNGRFLEIGKVDFVSDNALFIHQLSDNKSFHGILMDALCLYSDSDRMPRRVEEERKRIHKLVAEGLESGVVRPLKRTVFERNEVEKAFRFMASGKHIGKVVIRMKDEEVASQSINLQNIAPGLKVAQFSPFKSYIVIGGLGGFGLELVHWLAQKGAKTIVICSRRGIRDSYQRYAINRLQEQGVNLVLSTADATRAEGTKALLEVATSVAPVGGIFNSAVVLKDTLFSEQTPDLFELVVDPKAAVTLLLDKISREMCPQLDYFVVFSSLSCGRGNEGQTNYNFGNSVMDSICEARRAEGLPGLSIQWGLIGDVGVVAEREGRGSLGPEVAVKGISFQRIQSCLETLDRVLQSSDFSVIASFVRHDQNKSGQKESADILKIIANLMGLKDMVNMDPTTSLGKLGIDSLINVEIKQVIERIHGISLSLSEIRDLTVSNLMQLKNK